MVQHASPPHQPDPDLYHHLHGQPCQPLLLLLFIPPQPNWPLWCCDHRPHMHLCNGSSPCWSVLPRVASECHLLIEAFTDSTNQITIFSPSPNTVTIIFYFSLSTQHNLKPFLSSFLECQLHGGRPIFVFSPLPSPVPRTPCAWIINTYLLREWMSVYVNRWSFYLFQAVCDFKHTFHLSGPHSLRLQSGTNYTKLFSQEKFR